MRIAVNAGSLTTENLATFLNLVKLHPEHIFLFISEKENNTVDSFENIIPVVIAPPLAIPVKSRVWYNLQLPAVLKKNKADIFISEKFVSLKTKVPQILVRPDLTFIHQPSLVDKKQISFYKKNEAKFLEKANAIVVNSVFLKREVIDRYKILEEKIKVIYPTAKNLTPATFEEKQLMKEKYAEGNEYFIYKGTISPEKNLVNLLKAFSFFKKRQRSKMQLLITGTPGEKYEEFVRSLQSYKFKNDVRLLMDLSQSEKEKILASAYAMVYVPLYEGEGNEVIEAMQSAIPLIVSDIEFLQEYCAGAALYVKPDNVKDIAEKMMLLFKDEQKRKDFIEKGKAQLKVFEYKNATEELFEMIRKVAG